jgi:FixJ family two-component response regulator
MEGRKPDAEHASLIYVVDDDKDVREALGMLFESLGWSAVTFGSTVDFLQYKRPEKTSCLILDVRLPGLSGLDLQTELAKAAVEIPIIFITGYGDIPMSVRAMKAGAVDFLTKPVREQDLLDAVHRALDRDREKRELDSSVRDLSSRFEALSDREEQVMSLVCAGLMNKQGAAVIGLSEITFKVHRHSVMKKLGARSLVELVRMADRLGLASEGHTPARNR